MKISNRAGLKIGRIEFTGGTGEISREILRAAQRSSFEIFRQNQDQQSQFTPHSKKGTK